MGNLLWAYHGQIGGQGPFPSTLPDPLLYLSLYLLPYLAEKLQS